MGTWGGAWRCDPTRPGPLAPVRSAPAQANSPVGGSELWVGPLSSCDHLGREDGQTGAGEDKGMDGGVAGAAHGEGEGAGVVHGDEGPILHGEDREGSCGASDGGDLL